MRSAACLADGSNQQKSDKENARRKAGIPAPE